MITKKEMWMVRHGHDMMALCSMMKRMQLDRAVKNLDKWRTVIIRKKLKREDEK